MTFFKERVDKRPLLKQTIYRVTEMSQNVKRLQLRRQMTQDEQNLAIKYC